LFPVFAEIRFVILISTYATSKNLPELKNLFVICRHW